MKILVVFTGGTIGSAVSDGWIAPSDDMKYLLLKKFREKNNSSVEFDTTEPFSILSENLCAENLNKLIKCVSENVGSYDGIIVTHGSDTLQYTAAALAYCVETEIPVVLVSSNYPLEDERANGTDNFIAATEFITAKAGKGVFISYKNKNEYTHIHSATRVISHRESDDCVFSIDSQPYAFFDGKILLNSEYTVSHSGEKITDGHFADNSEILVAFVLPGESFCYDVSRYKAVILRPYHSGTLNTESGMLKNFCENAKKHSVPVFVVNVPKGTTYLSSKEYDSLGVNALYECSFPAVYVKLWLGISMGKEIVSFVKNPVADEFL